MWVTFDLLLLINLCLKGEASSGKHITSAEVVRNLEWATSTCVLGFSVFGESDHSIISYDPITSVVSHIFGKQYIATSK